MRRKLVISMSVLSLLLCVATATLWVRSYSAYDVVGREAFSGIGTELISENGRVVFYHWNSYRNNPPPQEWSASSFPPSSQMGGGLRNEFDFSDGRWWNRAGFVL